MTEETIVAMYDTPAHAQAAISDLKAANVPPNAISSHAQGGAAGTTATHEGEHTHIRISWAAIIEGDRGSVAEARFRRP